MKITVKSLVLEVFLVFQVLDGTFVSLNLRSTPSKSLNICETIVQCDSKGQFCSGLHQRCSRHHDRPARKFVLQATKSGPAYTKVHIGLPSMTLAQRHRHQVLLQSSKTPSGSSALQFETFAGAPRHGTYTRDAIICGDERIPFLRAAFGNNDDVDAKVTVRRAERTPLHPPRLLARRTDSSPSSSRSPITLLLRALPAWVRALRGAKSRPSPNRARHETAPIAKTRASPPHRAADAANGPRPQQ